MIVALYARVSTADQDESLQVPRLQDYAKRSGFEVFKLYTDEASGRNGNRPGWQALMSDARGHRFDAVIVTKLDRVMRNLIGFYELMQDFQARGIRLITLDYGVLDPSTAIGGLQVNLLAMLADWERAIISERTREALAAKKARGIALGRPKTDVPISKVAQLRLKGVTWVEAARLTGVNRTTLMRHKDEIQREMWRIEMEGRI